MMSLFKIASFDTKNGGGSKKGEINLNSAIIKPLRKMQISSEMGNMEIFENLEKMDRYLQDEESVIKLCYFAPTHRQGLSFLAEGLFSNN